MPTKRSTAAMNTKKTTKAFLKQRRGFLYSAIKMMAFGSDIENERNTKGIPLLRQSDFLKSGSMALVEHLATISVTGHVLQLFSIG